MTPTDARGKKAFAAYSQFVGTKVMKVSYDDGNVHLEFDNGYRLALNTDNFDESDFVCDDRPTMYFKGDLAVYTGQTEMIYGKTWYVIELLEGHLKGQKKVVSKPPKAVR